MTQMQLPITTSRLVLRTLRDTDFDDLFEMATHPDVYRYIRPPMTAEQTRDHIQERMPPWFFEDMKWYSLAVHLKEETRVMGEVVFRYESRDCRRMEIGYRFHPEYQGKGYAYEAVKVVADELFEVFKIHKMAAYCIRENQPSRRLLEKMGMKEEGVKRDQQLLNGQWFDLVVYGVLEHEFTKG